MDKIMVTEVTSTYVDFDGDSLLRLKNQVNEWIETYGEEAFIERRPVPYEDNHYEYKLCTYREETDKEYEDRKGLERRREAGQRAQYEMLKKKFGNT